jgi:excisionase family DNA binding protein
MAQKQQTRPVHHAGPLSALTIRSTSERLGCSENTVYRLIAAGKLRAVDIAPPGSLRSKTRVRSDDLDAYIESITQKPKTGPAVAAS